MVFEGMYQQNVADALKAFVLRRNPPAERKRGIESIRMLERAEWNPTVFQEALKAASPGYFYEDTDGDYQYEPGEDGPRSGFEATIVVIERYTQYMEQGHF